MLIWLTVVPAALICAAIVVILLLSVVETDKKAGLVYAVRMFRCDIEDARKNFFRRLRGRQF